MYLLELTLQGLPKMTNANSGNWRMRQREAHKWQRMVIDQIVIQRCLRPAEPLKQAVITLTRHSSKMPDYDGLVSGCKHIIDGLKMSNIIIDDNMLVVGQPVYRWQSCSPKEGKMHVRVQEIG